VPVARSVKDKSSRIAVIAGRGHFRDSLVALLRNLPQEEIVLLDISYLAGDAHTSQRMAPDIIVVVPEGPGFTFHEALPALRQAWPEARFVALVDHVWRARQGQDLGVDCILAKSTPAGEFLPAIRKLLRYVPHPQVEASDLKPAAPARERLDVVISTTS
jgi:DNA-binding NarL/FixJ family response regulator